MKFFVKYLLSTFSNFDLFYNDSEKVHTPSSDHARWHRCLRIIYLIYLAPSRFVLVNYRRIWRRFKVTI